MAQSSTLLIHQKTIVPPSPRMRPSPIRTVSSRHVPSKRRNARQINLSKSTKMLPSNMTQVKSSNFMNSLELLSRLFQLSISLVVTCLESLCLCKKENLMVCRLHYNAWVKSWNLINARDSTVLLMTLILIRKKQIEPNQQATDTLSNSAMSTTFSTASFRENQQPTTLTDMQLLERISKIWGNTRILNNQIELNTPTINEVGDQ